MGSPLSVSQSGISSANQQYKVNSSGGPGGAADQSPYTDNPEDEPFYKFYSNITTMVSKTHTQTRDRSKFTNKYYQSKGINKTSSPSSSKLSDAAGGFRNPTDSYYVVPTSETDEPQEGLAAENAKLKEALMTATRSLEAYSDTFERQKGVLKSSLAQLRSEIQAKEQQKTQELNTEIEELQAENDKLKIQMGRMKSRWEGLKESARKRR